MSQSSKEGAERLWVQTGWLGLLFHDRRETGQCGGLSPFQGPQAWALLLTTFYSATSNRAATPAASPSVLAHAPPAK